MSTGINSCGPMSVDEITRLADRLLEKGGSARDMAASMDMTITGISPEQICEQLASDCGIIWCSECCIWVDLGSTYHPDSNFVRTPTH